MTKRNAPAIRGPRVGDRLMKTPELGYENIKGTIPCTVVYVNEEHLYYTVLFDVGYRQAFRFYG